MSCAAPVTPVTFKFQNPQEWVCSWAHFWAWSSCCTSSWVAVVWVATGVHGLLSASCFLWQVQAIWPDLPQYRQSLFLKQHSFSSTVSFPKGLGHWGTVALICGSSITRFQFLAG